MQILVVNYMEMDPASSGSGVRPQKMYRAFQELGHQVYLLSGSQDRAARDRRRADVEAASRWLDENKPDLCYIESPVYPILWSFDRELIRKIHAQGIPIGYYYRDFQDRFPALFPKRKDIPGRLKDLWLAWKRKQTDRLLHSADIVYLPSEACKELFSFRDMRPLPPAGEDRLPGDPPSGQTSIYVGGILGIYDGAGLLDVYSRLNEEGDYPLILVCREKEWKKLDHPQKNAPWLEVHHASGEALEPLYRRSALGLCFFTDNEYCRYAVSVKLNEYMGHGLPLLIRRAEEMERIARRDGTGLCVGGDERQAADTIRSYFADGSLRRELFENVCAAVRRNGLWKHRAEQVVRELKKGSKL